MLDYEQMAGRGGRDGLTKCLVLLLAEPWLFEPRDEDIDKATQCSKALRTDDDVFRFVQSEECRREFLAELNNDNNDEGK